jgi:hypothetical protein
MFSHDAVRASTGRLPALNLNPRKKKKERSFRGPRSKNRIGVFNARAEILFLGANRGNTEYSVCVLSESRFLPGQNNRHQIAEGHSLKFPTTKITQSPAASSLSQIVNSQGRH